MTGFRGSRYDRGWLGGKAIPHVDSARVPRSTERAPAPGSARASNGSSAAVRGSRDADAEAYDWERLERAVRSLVERNETLEKQADDLRARLADRERCVDGLESQLLEANQNRQDTGKRIDELIAQLDQLDAELEGAEASE